MTISTFFFVTGSCFDLGGLLLVIWRWSDAEFRHLAFGLYALGNAFGFVANAAIGNIPWAVYDGVWAAIWAWMWWRGRRKGRGKKALKELGAKSRARVEALARQMTPSPIPAPGGAR